MTDVPTATPDDEAPCPRRPWWRGTRERKALVVVEVVLIGLIGGWLGLLAGGTLDAGGRPAADPAVGPAVGRTAAASCRSRRWASCGSHTHAGPWRLDAEVTRINAADARQIFSDPAVGERARRAGGRTTCAARWSRWRSSAAVAAGRSGALLLGVLVFRRRWRLRPAQPAPSARRRGARRRRGGRRDLEPEGDQPAGVRRPAGQRARRRRRRARHRVQLRQVRGPAGPAGHQRLPALRRHVDPAAYQPDPSTIRVLFVSDLHLNPAAWDVIRSVAKQFDVDMIVDSGDLTDHGSAPENAYVDQIATLGAPYVWVRGNHDSAGHPGRGRGAAQRGGARLDHAGRGRRAAVPRASATRGSPRTRTPAAWLAPSSVAQVGLRMADAMRRAAGRREGRRRGGARRRGRRPDGRHRAAGAVRALPPARAAPAARRDAVVLAGLDRRLRAARAGAREADPGAGVGALLRPGHPSGCRRGTTSPWAGSGWCRPRSSGGSWGSSSPSWRRS